MKKIIIISTTVFLVLALGITSLVMGLVWVGFDVKIERPYNVYISSSKTNSLPNKMIILRDRNENEKAKINSIYDLFKEAFQQKALNALFAGELNGNADTNYGVIATPMSKNYNSEDKITIIFEYKEAKKVFANDTEYEYKFLFFEIGAVNERKDNTFGVNKNLSDEAVSTVSYNYSLSAKANFNKLFNYVNGLM